MQSGSKTGSVVKLFHRLPRLEEIRKVLRPSAGLVRGRLRGLLSREVLIIAGVGVLAAVTTLTVLTVSFNTRERRIGEQERKAIGRGETSQEEGELSVDDFLLPTGSAPVE